MPAVGAVVYRLAAAWTASRNEVPHNSLFSRLNQVDIACVENCTSTASIISGSQPIPLPAKPLSVIAIESTTTFRPLRAVFWITVGALACFGIGMPALTGQGLFDETDNTDGKDGSRGNDKRNRATVQGNSSSTPTNYRGGPDSLGLARQISKGNSPRQATVFVSRGNDAQTQATEQGNSSSTPVASSKLPSKDTSPRLVGSAQPLSRSTSSTPETYKTMPQLQVMPDTDTAVNLQVVGPILPLKQDQMIQVYNRDTNVPVIRCYICELDADAGILIEKGNRHIAFLDTVTNCLTEQGRQPLPWPHSVTIYQIKPDPQSGGDIRVPKAIATSQQGSGNLPIRTKLQSYPAGEDLFAVMQHGAGYAYVYDNVGKLLATMTPSADKSSSVLNIGRPAASGGDVGMILCAVIAAMKLNES